MTKFIDGWGGRTDGRYQEPDTLDYLFMQLLDSNPFSTDFVVYLKSPLQCLHYLEDKYTLEEHETPHMLYTFPISFHATRMLLVINTACLYTVG